MAESTCQQLKHSGPGKADHGQSIDDCEKSESPCISDHVRENVAQRQKHSNCRRPHFSSDEVLAIFVRRPDLSTMLTGERMRRTFAALSKQVLSIVKINAIIFLKDVLLLNPSGGCIDF